MRKHGTASPSQWNGWGQPLTDASLWTIPRICSPFPVLSSVVLLPDKKRMWPMDTTWETKKKQKTDHLSDYFFSGEIILVWGTFAYCWDYFLFIIPEDFNKLSSFKSPCHVYHAPTYPSLVSKEQVIHHVSVELQSSFCTDTCSYTFLDWRRRVCIRLLAAWLVCLWDRDSYW